MATYTNLSILQGWFEVDSVQTTIVDRIKVAVIKGWIYTTDHNELEPFFDERHPVIITGRPAEAIIDITQKINEKYPLLTGINLVHISGDSIDQSQILVSQGRPYVIAQGKLLTHDGQSCIDIKHISFLGLPWGALDALNELEPVMNRGVRELVATLSSREKYQINQALGVAMQALVALRPTCQNVE
jgi:hypothetical protein